jgi:hypothetical protein
MNRAAKALLFLLLCATPVGAAPRAPSALAPPARKASPWRVEVKPTSFGRSRHGCHVVGRLVQAARGLYGPLDRGAAVTFTLPSCKALNLRRAITVNPERQPLYLLSPRLRFYSSPLLGTP